MTPEQFIDLVALTAKKMAADDTYLSHPEDVWAYILTAGEVLVPALATMKYEWKMNI